MFGSFEFPALANVASREELLAEASTESALAETVSLQAFLDSMGSEEVAPPMGLRIRTEQFISDPDGNTIDILFIRPDNAEILSCVYYIHGGGKLTPRSEEHTSELQSLMRTSYAAYSWKTI